MPQRLWEGWYRRYYDEAPYRCASFLVATAFFLLAMAFGVLMLVQQWDSVDPLKLFTLALLLLMASYPWFFELRVRGRVCQLLRGYQGKDREELAKDASRYNLAILTSAYFVMAMAFLFLGSALIR
jgi:hypothetical protein